MTKGKGATGVKKKWPMLELGLFLFAALVIWGWSQTGTVLLGSSQILLFIEALKLSISLAALLFLFLLQQSHSPALTNSPLLSWHFSAFLAVLIAEALFSLLFGEVAYTGWFSVISLALCAMIAAAYLVRRHTLSYLQAALTLLTSISLFYSVTISDPVTYFVLKQGSLAPIGSFIALVSAATLCCVSLVLVLTYGVSRNLLPLLPLIVALIGYVEVFTGINGVDSAFNVVLHCLFFIFIIKSCLLLNAIAARFIAMMHNGMNSNPSVFFCGDDNGRLLFANGSFYELFSGDKAHSIDSGKHPLAEHPLWDDICKQLKKGATWTGETTLKDCHGGLIAVHLNVSYVQFESWYWHQVSLVNLQEKVELQQKSDDAKGRLEQLSFDLMEKQEEERRYFAKELHDEIGQGLTLLKIQHQLPEPDKELITHVLSELIDKVRNLSLNLRPAILDDMGLSAALTWLIDRQGQFSQLKIVNQISQDIPRLKDKIEISVFRIAQEAFTNIHKYAHAKEVKVFCHVDHDLLKFVISDDGIGFDVDAKFNHAIKSQSLGLVSIKERALLVHGGIEIESGADKGTQITLSIPLSVAKKNEE